MKKKIVKTLLFFCLIFWSPLLLSQVAPDEDTGSYTTCNADGANETKTSNDLPNAVNLGTIDDRTCYANYKESTVYGKTWGIYNITDGSTNQGNLIQQPRMERSLSRSTKTGIGSFAKFTGTFRILEVGDTGSFGSSGSYLAQAKGKHTGGSGSTDPAILLYRAHPVYGDGVNADKQIAFDIYAERILERGGVGSSGREVVFLKRVNKNEEVDFQLEVGFRVDPNDATKKVHYCDAIIGGEAFNYNIPSPERGLESGIRYGAYRVRGGRAQFRWANTTYQKEEIEDINIAEPSDDIYRLRNLATGKFLTDAGASNTAVTISDSGEPQNTHWTFVKSGDYYNIDSETFGIIRAKGTGEVVSTNKGAPATDVDKVWTIHDAGTENVYRIEAKNNGKFLYNEVDGSVTNKDANVTDQRSIWEAIPTSQSLSLDDDKLVLSSIKIYPNPAKHNFTILFNNLDGVKNIEIYNLLGKLVFEKTANESNININSKFNSGSYFVKIISDDNKVFYRKLVIK
ncbi:MAG: T9SS type A sorting domain-containing protein [Polaribacter sp.]